MQAKAVWRDRWQGWFTWRFHRHPGICWKDEWPRDLVIDQWWLWQPVMSIGCQSQQCSVPFNNDLQARCSCWHQWVLCEVFKSLRLHIECEWWMLSCNVSLREAVLSCYLVLSIKQIPQRSSWVDMYKRKQFKSTPGSQISSLHYSLSPLAWCKPTNSLRILTVSSFFEGCEGWNIGEIHTFLDASENSSVEWHPMCIIYWAWPLPRIPVTTRIITFLVGNPYKPLFATATGKGPHPMYLYMFKKNPVLPGTSKDLIDVGEENSSIPTQWHSTKLEQCVFDVWIS